MTENTENPKPKSRRGFAAMSPEKRALIAQMGGKAAHAKGTAHKWTSEEASAAGYKGGKAVSKDKNHMAQIGRIGGRAKADKDAEV